MKARIQALMERMSEGFSLVEILIAIAILAVAIIAMIGVFPQGVNQVVMSKHISTINHLGQSKLDDLRATPWSDNDLLDGTHPSTGLGEAANVETNANFSDVPSGYSREWRVTTSGDRKTVEVTVGYLFYQDDATPITASTITSGPQAIHRRSSEFTTILTRP